MSVLMHDLTYRYPGSGHGVSDIGLNVAAGELVAVIGASGCGKSTLLRLVAGLLPTYGGSISIDGKPMAGVPVWQRGVGMVFQSYALFPHLSLIDNVAYGLRMRGQPSAQRRRTATELLALVGLQDEAQRRPAQLSGGQQQRVALARALAYRPSVLLLDEPLAALDAHVRIQLSDELRSIQRRFGAATLLVTHDQQEAMSIADRVAVLQDGRLLQVDTPRGLYERPSSAAVARFVGHANLVRATVSGPGHVACAWGELHCDTGGHALHSEVTLLVRPEAIVADAPVDHVNRLSGQTERVRFLGATCRYDFVAEGPQGARWLCEGVSPASQHIALPPRSITVLPAEAGAAFLASPTSPTGEPQ